MSLNVQEGDLHSTVLMIAEMGGLNVAIDDSVQGSITISFDEIEPIDALKIIARTKNLMLTEEGNIFILTADRANNSLRNSYVLKIKYGDADVLRNSIALALDLDEEDNSDRGRRRLKSVTSTDDENQRTREYEYFSDEETDVEKKLQRLMVDRDTNSLILYGTRLEYDRALKILSELDVPLKQVSIEAKILAIDKSATKDLGVDWLWSIIPQNSSVRSDQMDKSEAHGIWQFGRAASGVQQEWYYGAQISALITNGKAKMLSKPNITTIQGHEAVINVGDEVPVPRVDVSNSITTTSIEYKDASIKLICLPRINVDGSITAQIHTEVSTPHYVADLKAYRFNTRSADTTVTMRDMEPIVIGGLIGADEERSIRKIPFLGDLPILGSLFKSVRRNKSDSELVIFLTAHVIDD